MWLGHESSLVRQTALLTSTKFLVDAKTNSDSQQDLTSFDVQQIGVLRCLFPSPVVTTVYFVVKLCGHYDI